LTYHKEQFGESIGLMDSSDDSFENIVQSWIQTKESYNWALPGNSTSWTQIVWKTTTSLGCAWRTCNISAYGSSQSFHYLVCDYYPAGNAIGQSASEEATWFSANIGTLLA
jgi:hypothetical protein